MKEMLSFAISFGCLIVGLSGCSSSYPITYDSNPRGASIICNGSNWGYTPKTLYYNFDKATKESGKARTALCSAKWVSGVEENYSQEWDLTKFPYGVRQTLQRPNGDGYEKDAQFALQVEILQAHQAQAAAQQAAANAAAQQNFNQTIQNMNYNLQMQQQNFQLQQLNNNLMFRRYGY